MAPLDKLKEVLHLKKKDETSKEGGSGSAKKRIFDDKDVVVVFVLGGPGAGKGTQCANIVRDYGFKHLSAGDLLRAEQHREGSQLGSLISEYIREGKIVPSEVTIKLLENAIRHELETRKPETAGVGWEDGRGRFLIDGFPRKMDQAEQFDDEVCLSRFTLFFSTTEEVMLERLTERGKTSGREDDNIESIKKRFKTYEDTTMPVIEHYRKLNKVVEIDATPSIPEVYEAVKKELDAKLAS
ncbi:UMP-CMP kinase [Tulasnella sp. 418]|nr:UMP-CMP kinase [Tulasnella sp. 418]